MSKLFKELESHIAKAILSGAILGVVSLIVFYFSITSSDAQQTTNIDTIQADIQIIKDNIRIIEREPTKVKVARLEENVIHLDEKLIEMSDKINENHKEIMLFLLKMKD